MPTLENEKTGPNTIKGVDIDDIFCITLNDYSDYDERFCRNGGRYAFWTEYTNIGNDEWERTEHTTAEFPYCPVCGTFGSCNCDKNFEVISTDELKKIVNSFEEDDDHYIEITHTIPLW